MRFSISQKNYRPLSILILADDFTGIYSQAFAIYSFGKCLFCHAGISRRSSPHLLFFRETKKCDLLFLRTIIAYDRFVIWPMTWPGFMIWTMTLPRHLGNACFAIQAFSEGLFPIFYFFVKRKNTIFYFFDIFYLFVKNKKYDFLFLWEINAPFVND